MMHYGDIRKTDVTLQFIILISQYLLSCALTIGIFDKHLSLLDIWHTVGTVHFTDIIHLSLTAGRCDTVKEIMSIYS
jgi:hypothetical protein